MSDSRKDDPGLYTLDGMDIFNGSEMGVSGISYTNFVNDRIWTKTIFSVVYQNTFTRYDSLNDMREPHPNYHEGNRDYRLSFKYIYNKKYSARFVLRFGIGADRLGYHLNTRYFNSAQVGWEDILNQKNMFGKGTGFSHVYIQADYRLSDNIGFKPGIGGVYFGLNDTWNIEPRLGFSWRFASPVRLNLGVGYHSKMLSLATYFYETRDETGQKELSNLDLDLLKAIHYVAGMDIIPGRNFRIKLETYYQYLMNIPVEVQSSSYS